MTTTTRRIQLASLAGMLLLGASALQGQACLGLPDLRHVPRSVSTTGAGTDLGRTVVARYGVAGERLFGGAQVGYAGQTFARPQSPVYGGDVGIVVPLGTSGATQLCPVLQSVYQHGPRSSAHHTTRLATSLGLSLGRRIGVSSSVAVMPFVQGGVQHLRQSYGYTSLGIGPNGEPGLGQWGETHTVYGEMAVGFGLRLNDRVTVSPAYRIPVGLGSAPNPITGAGGSRNRIGVYQQTYSLSLTVGLPR